MLFQLVLLKTSAVQKTVNLLWVAYLSWLFKLLNNKQFYNIDYFIVIL